MVMGIGVIVRYDGRAADLVIRVQAIALLVVEAALLVSAAVPQKRALAVVRLALRAQELQSHPRNVATSARHPNQFRVGAVGAANLGASRSRGDP